MSDWDRFFDELYLLTYAPRLDTRDATAEALGAVALAGCPDGGDVLDCPCGYGRHSIALAAAGFRVVGADRSRRLLDEARSRGGDGEWPAWTEADYRELPFDDASFHCVLNLFTSLGYHGDDADRRALGEFRRVLRPSGALVVETMHRDRLARIFQPRSWDPLPDEGVLVERRTFDLVSGVTEVDHTFIAGDGERRQFSYRLRPYTVTQLDAMLRDAGFVDVEHFGGYDREPLTPDTRLVAVARAPG